MLLYGKMLREFISYRSSCVHFIPFLFLLFIPIFFSTLSKGTEDNSSSSQHCLLDKVGISFHTQCLSIYYMIFEDGESLKALFLKCLIFIHLQQKTSTLIQSQNKYLFFGALFLSAVFTCAYVMNV